MNGKTKIESDGQKYFYSALVDILSTIYESNPNCCAKSIPIKLTFIYLISFFKESKIINLEIICKVFFNLENCIQNLKNNKIEKEVYNFEETVINTIKICLNKYISDYEVDIQNDSCLDNFNTIIINLCSLGEKMLPLHLKGFIEYNKKSNPLKLLIIKIYEYIKLINPFKDDQTIFIFIYIRDMLYMKFYFIMKIIIQ